MFLAQVVMIAHPEHIVTGYTPVVHCHTASIACRFDKIRYSMDRRTGRTLETSPERARNGDMIMVEMKPIKPMCVETFGKYPRMGRFAVRDMKRTIAVGVIKEVTPKKDSNEEQNKLND